MLASLDPKPVRIFTSPYVRARLTAAIIAEQLGLPAPTVSEYLALDSDQRQILGTINETNEQPMLLVGHEPHLRELASLLVAGHRHMHVSFGNATTVCIDLPTPAVWESGTLEWIKDVD